MLTKYRWKFNTETSLFYKRKRRENKIKKITVNGVDLMDIQRRKKIENMCTPTSGRKKPPKRKITDRKTAPSIDSKEKITKERRN